MGLLKKASPKKNTYCEDKVKAFAEDLKEYYEDLQKLQNRFKQPTDAEAKDVHK